MKTFLTTFLALVLYWNASLAKADICDRTDVIASKIGKAVGKLCVDIDAEDLAQVYELDLTERGISALQQGDFSGLTGLRALYLNENPLKELPAGIFDDLISLDVLSFSQTQVATLSPELFKNLAELTELRLGDNGIEEIPAGLFAPLKKLHILDLSGNRISVLAEDVFSQQTLLYGLYLAENRLKTLPLGIFQGMKKLSYVSLARNRIATIASEVFLAQGDGPELTFDVSLADNPISEAQRSQLEYQLGNRVQF
jgi:Leucine-rich repeat (LRR) protein